MSSSKAAEVAGRHLSSSADDARQLATAFSGIKAMSDNLHTWLKDSACTRSSIGSISGGSAADGDDAGGGLLTAAQVGELLQRVSTFNSYAVAHAETSAQMATRAELRASEAKSALQETEREAAEETTKESNKKKKRPSGGGTLSKSKPVKKKKSMLAAAAAGTPSTAIPQKAKPTKLDKDIAMELKIIRSASSDKSNDYTVRRALQRIEALLVKNNGSKGGGAEALISVEDGIDTVFVALARQNRAFFKSSDDMRYIEQSAKNIVEIIVSVDGSQLLLPDRFGAMLQDITKRKTSSIFVRAIMALAQNSSHRDEIGKLITAEVISTMCSVSYRTGPKDEPADYEFVSANRHQETNSFLQSIADSPEGLRKMQEKSEEVIRFVNAHEKEYEAFSNWSSELYSRGTDCEACCHVKANRVKELLGKH